MMDLRVVMLFLSCVVSVLSKDVDYYAILGVQRYADETEIRSAFKRLAKIWHPDKMEETKSWGGSEQFIALREAYEVLSNSIKREIYNRNNPEAGIYKSWWGSLLSAWDELTILVRQSKIKRSIIQKSIDFLLKYELLTIQLVINAVSEVPVFMSKLENALNKLKHIKREAKYKIFDKRNWWDLKNSASAKSVRAFIKILGLSSLCLISRYLSRQTVYRCHIQQEGSVEIMIYKDFGLWIKVIQGILFVFFVNLPIFPGLLAIYILLLASRKHAFVVFFGLAFGEMVLYRIFISPILSDIWHDADAVLKKHQTGIFIYSVMVTILSFPVFLKYRTRCHFFPFCLCAMCHIAVCTAAFESMTFTDAVSFFVCQTMLAFLIDKMSTIFSVLIYSSVQITSGVCLESSPQLFALTIALMIICWLLSYYYKDSRKLSLRPWNLVRFLQRKADADRVTDTHQNQTEEKEEHDLSFTKELQYYFTLTAVCLSVMFIHEFY